MTRRRTLVRVPPHRRPEGFLGLLMGNKGSRLTHSRFSSSDDSKNGIGFFDNLCKSYEKSLNELGSSKKKFRASVVAFLVTLATAVYSFFLSSPTESGWFALLIFSIIMSIIIARIAFICVRKINKEKKNIEKMPADPEVLDNIHLVIAKHVAEHNITVNMLYHFLSTRLAQNEKWDNFPDSLQEFFRKKYQQLQERKVQILGRADVLMHMFMLENIEQEKPG